MKILTYLAVTDGSPHYSRLRVVIYHGDKSLYSDNVFFFLETQHIVIFSWFSVQQVYGVTYSLNSQKWDEAFAHLKDWYSIKGLDTHVILCAI